MIQDRVIHFRGLEVYKLAFNISFEIFNITKTFPVEEKYSLTDQIRRSSRSVCANIAEAWKKRIYPAAFVSKLNDSESECAETQVWLEFCHKHNYISEPIFKDLDNKCEHVSAMLIKMVSTKEQWIIRKK